MSHDIQIPIFKDNFKKQAFVTFVNRQNRKVTMEIKYKQRAVIEFLLLEGCAGEKIMVRLQNIHGSAAY
jgi:hypothetical protein